MKIFYKEGEVELLWEFNSLPQDISFINNNLDLLLRANKQQGAPACATNDEENKFYGKLYSQSWQINRDKHAFFNYQQRDYSHKQTMLAMSPLRIEI